MALWRASACLLSFAGCLPVGFFSLSSSFSFVFFLRLFFSLSLPTRMLHFRRAVHSSWRERASGGLLDDSPHACGVAAARLANNARRDPLGLRAKGPSPLAQSSRCGAGSAARRRKRKSVSPLGSPTRGFDNRASRAMIRPSLLRCLRKAQAFGRRWG